MAIIKKEETIKRLKNKMKLHHLNYSKNFEQEVAKKIIAPPLDVATKTDMIKLFGKDYTPGTFKISERKYAPDYLFDEEIQDYMEWVFSRVEAETKLLLNIPILQKLITDYDKLTLQYDVYNIIHFKVDNQNELHNYIINQEYSDVFRRILSLLLLGEIQESFDTHSNFNKLGYDIGFPVLELTEEYDLYKRLKQSIASGLIGMDIKDEVSAASPLSIKGIIPLNIAGSLNDKIHFVREELDKRINENLAIDCWEEYKKEVIETNQTKIIVWFTDDFIPTIFELKFIEQQLTYNKNLIFYVIPRRFRYGNDASYNDIQNFIIHPLFRDLNKMKNEKRIFICSSGPDMGTFNGYRISKEVAKILLFSNIVVITGARSYEMGQGIKKITFFSGIAVCRRYSETVTGLDMEAGESIFLRQDPGICSFQDFRARAWKTIKKKDGKLIHVARMTTSEYASAIKCENYDIILRRFKNNNKKANKWIIKQCNKKNLTFYEFIINF